MDRQNVGAIYVTAQNEIGISILKRFQGFGYGKAAVLRVMEILGPREYLANINPANKRSAAMFKSLGFGLIQHTYRRES